MPVEKTPNGVLDEKYAEQRRKKPELAYRLATRSRLVVESVRSYLPNRSHLNVLDMGCAEGRVLVELAGHLPQSRFVGIEYSRGLVNMGKDIPAKIAVIQGDVTALPFCDTEEAFDVVCALAVLEHLDSPEAAVAEAERVLKPGGLFVATSPAPVWDRVSTTLGLLEDDSHVTRLGRRRLIDLLQNTTLDFCAFRRFMWAPIAFLPYLHVPVSSGFSLRVDRFIERLKFMNLLFVNQAIVARKRL